MGNYLLRMTPAVRVLEIAACSRIYAMLSYTDQERPYLKGSVYFFTSTSTVPAGPALVADTVYFF